MTYAENASKCMIEIHGSTRKIREIWKKGMHFVGTLREATGHKKKNYIDLPGKGNSPQTIPITKPNPKSNWPRLSHQGPSALYWLS
jgi:hypothetical protein